MYVCPQLPENTKFTYENYISILELMTSIWKGCWVLIKTKYKYFYFINTVLELRFASDFIRTLFHVQCFSLTYVYIYRNASFTFVLQYVNDEVFRREKVPKLILLIQILFKLYHLSNCPVHSYWLVCVSFSLQKVLMIFLSHQFYL